MADRNIDGKIQVPFTKASTLSNLDGTGNGENIVTAFSKLAKWYDSLADKIEKGDVFGMNATKLTSSNHLSMTGTQGLYYWLDDSIPTDAPYIKLNSSNGRVKSAFMIVYRFSDQPTYADEIVQIIIPFSPQDGLKDSWSLYIKHGGSATLVTNSWYLIESTAEFDTTPTSGSANGITSGAVYSALTDAINSLDVSNITANLGTDKTLTALSQTDGKISATASKIQIGEDQVTDLTTDLAGKQPTLVVGTNLDATPTNGSNNPVTSDGVYDALATKLESSDVFGLGTQITTAGSFSGNLDNVKTAGCYYWVDTDIPTNAPYKGLVAADGAIGNATLYVIKNAYTNRYTQFAIPQGKPQPLVIGLYMRNSYSSSGSEVWTDWQYLEPTSHYDASPTQDSANACTSGGIYTSLSGKQDTITFEGTYNASTNKAATQTTVSDAITALGLGTAATSGVTNGIIKDSTDLLMSGGAFRNVPKISTSRGEEIPANADLNASTYLNAGRYYANNSSSSSLPVGTILNTPLTAGDLPSGYTLADATSLVGLFMQLTVEDAGGASSNLKVIQTITFSISNGTTSGSTKTKALAFENWLVGTVWKRWYVRTNANNHWSNWFRFSGTEIIPTS